MIAAQLATLTRGNSKRQKTDGRQIRLSEAEAAALLRGDGRAPGIILRAPGRAARVRAGALCNHNLLRRRSRIVLRIEVFRLPETDAVELDCRLFIHIRHSVPSQGMPGLRAPWWRNLLQLRSAIRSALECLLFGVPIEPENAGLLCVHFQPKRENGEDGHHE